MSMMQFSFTSAGGVHPNSSCHEPNILQARCPNLSTALQIFNREPRRGSDFRCGDTAVRQYRGSPTRRPLEVPVPADCQPATPQVGGNLCYEPRVHGEPSFALRMHWDREPKRTVSCCIGNTNPSERFAG